MNIDLHSREIRPLRNTFDHVAKYIGHDKTATRYEEATYGAQPSANFHYRPTWAPEYELFDAKRSKVVLADWYCLKDPRQFYYSTWTNTRARQQEAMEANFQFVENRGLLSMMDSEAVDLALNILLPLRHVAWGANMNNASICAYGYGTAFTAPAMFHAMDNLGIAQYITRLGLVMGEAADLDTAKEAWLNAPEWQGLRQLVEDSFVIADPFELFVAQNLCFDGLLYPLIYGQFVNKTLAQKGASSVALMTSFMTDWLEETSRWIDSVIKRASTESAENKQLIQQWTQDWSARALLALKPLSEKAFGADSTSVLAQVKAGFEQRAQKVGITV